MGGFMETQFFDWAINTGGTSIIILVGMYRLWNGNTKKIDETNKTVIDMDKRLAVVESKLGA